MQEQGSAFTETVPSILLAAGPQDEQAVTLVQRLREEGLHIIFAENATIAARAIDEAAACIAVLRPDTWKAQAIATIMRAKPACLIPVLAEPMELPRGPWTKSALDLSANEQQGTEELLQLLREQLAAYTAASRPVERQKLSSPAPNVTRLGPRRVRINISGLISMILATCLILGLVGLFAYRYFRSAPDAGVTTNSVASTTVNDTYNAAIPGQNCDIGGGQWETSGRYIKTVNKKQVEVLDKYTTLQCQSNGALVTRSGDYGVYSELFFDGPAGETTLAPHYFAQVNTDILSGDNRADFTIDAHVETNTYGRYGFDVNTLGHWEANLKRSSDGSSFKRLALGFLPQNARTYTLAIEVDGPLMTFFINGAQVTSVTDTTYTNNASVSFGFSDSTATSPIRALFSNFLYKALPASASPGQMMATATALAQNSMHTAYSTHIPGYICDKGNGQWQPPADANNPGRIHCQSNGMQLTEPANGQTIAEEDFYWLDGHFPQNYKVSAHIDVSSAPGCAALGTRESGDTDHYASYDFVVCPDGTWRIELITNTFQTLARGMTDAKNSYTLTAESNGSVQSLSIDGQLVQTVTDTRLASTDHISLDAGLYTSSQPTSAVFSDFTFTPLP